MTAKARTPNRRDEAPTFWVRNEPLRLLQRDSDRLLFDFGEEPAANHVPKPDPEVYDSENRLSAQPAGAESKDSEVSVDGNVTNKKGLSHPIK